MKSFVTPARPADLIKSYPISDRLDGWFFRVVERSASHYFAEGIDCLGHSVSREGHDDEALLSEVVADARSLQRGS